jgi:hypothetical protein
MTTTPLPPAGWHPDPWGVAPLRYWDGGQWTGYVHTPVSAGPDPSLKLLLPIGRSGWAIAAGYLGLVSVLLVFAPFALITGLLGLRAIRARPELWGRGRAWFGVIMGTVFTALLVVVLVAAQTR